MTDQLSLLEGPPHESGAFRGSVGGGVSRAFDVVVDGKVRGLCRRRYPGHPKGCPNYGKRPTCPPAAKPIADVISLDLPVWIAWNEYDLAARVEELRAKHPTWSDRQLRCVRYWQGTARKALDLRILAWLNALQQGSTGYSGCLPNPVHPVYPCSPPGLVVVRCPEACGVNVTETMRLVHVELEWPPVKIVRHVALIG